MAWWDPIERRQPSDRLDIVSTYSQLDSILDVHTMVANNLSLRLGHRGHAASVPPLPYITAYI